MINKLYLNPEDRFLVRDLHLITGANMPALYKAIKKAGIKTYRSFGNSLVIKAAELWKLCKTACFKKYYKKFLRRQQAGIYDKSDLKHYKFYEDHYPSIECMEESMWNENDLQNLGLPGLTRDEISQGLRCGFIPSIRYQGKFFVAPWFSTYWEANLDPDYIEFI